MKKRATLADVAQAAGVSLMTVSRAINQKPGVSEPLRKYILTLAEEMGYRPNTIARSLATSRTTAVGLVVPDNTNPFFAEIACGVEELAFDQQYNVFLVNSNEVPARETAALDSLWQKGVDGLILCSSRLSDAAMQSQVMRFPAVVLVNREIGESQPNLVTINVNDRRGAQGAMNYLAGRGRRQIAFIGGPAGSNSNRRRLEGYRLGLEAAGLAFDRQLVEHRPPTTEGGRAAATALLARHPGIDAILVFNDLAAVGALQQCLETGRRVPEDVAIIGADDIPLATIIRPQLTTLHVNLAEIGRLAMRTLVELIAGRPQREAVWIEPELILRGSA